MESPLSLNSTENFRKKLLLRNLKPYNVQGFYNSNNSSQNTDFVIIDYAVNDVQTVDVEAKLQEPKLIGLNKYTPSDGTFGELIKINKNLGTESNFGNYSYKQTNGSFLEIFGKKTEKDLLVQNQYNKPAGSFNNTVEVNLNKQTKANTGPYLFESSSPNLTSLQSQKQFYTINAYGPENGNDGYGGEIKFPVKIIGSNFGEYKFKSNGPNITTEQSQTNAFLSNFFGPPEGYTVVVDPNINKQTKANAGPYLSYTKLPERTTEQSQKIAFLSNIFGPEDQPNGFGSMVDPNLNFQTKTNQGEFNYETSSPNKSTIESQTFLYSKNKYNNGEGSYEVLTIDDFAFENINEPYYTSRTTFAFTPSDYSAASIITTDNVNKIQGSEGSLSQDSDLAKLAAKQLQKEFKARVAFELVQQTVGKLNSSTTTVDPVTGGVSAELKTDPFDALGVLTNNVPLIQKDFKITQLPTVVGSALGFVSKVSGLYSPYSLIPGEYFDYPQKNLLSQLASNPVGTVAGAVSNLATKILTPNIDTGSETLLASTSNAVKGLLFDMLYYNEYRPSYKSQSLLSPNASAPKGNFYIGNTAKYINDLVSPKTDLPKDSKGNPVDGPVYSYGRIGKDYEGNDVNQKLFGLNARSYYDKVGIQGGFTWVSKKNYLDPGRFVGPANEKGIIVPEDVDSVFSSGFKNTFDATKSSSVSLTPNSILDVTQRLVDAGSAASSNKLEHVGNAINQISKVFNDGYQEITKGSRARRFVTPTSKDSDSKEIVGYEYCRLFTKDRPYISYNQLQKKDGNIRGYGKSSSVLTNTYNLNIAPMGGIDSSNIQLIDGKTRAKKYMFSIENLAWRTSSRVGYRVEDLPACEIGPNGGRIMWFPPYDLSFDDSTQTTWQDTVFLGRPEPVYTYSKTSRKGTISFKIIVDHPSVLNVLVNKELEKTEESLATKVIDSFFAGCVKYDLVDLLKKYPMFSYSDIFETIQTLNNPEDIKKAAKDLPPSKPKEEKLTQEGGNILEINTTTTNNNEDVIKELENNKSNGGKYEEMILLFPESIPEGSGTKSSNTYETYYNQFIGLQTDYVSALNYKDISDGFFINYSKFSDKQESVNGNPEEIADKWIIAKPSVTTQIFNDASEEYNTFQEFLDKILTVLKSGAKVEFSLLASANANGNTRSNQELSERRLDSVLKQIYQKSDGESKIEDFLNKDFKEGEKQLKINPKAEGKNSTLKSKKYSKINCANEFQNSKMDGLASFQAVLCRRVTVTNLNITPAETKPEEKKSTEQKTKELEGTLPETNAAEINNPNNTETPASQNPGVSKTSGTKSTKVREDLTKRLLRKLLTECNYFEMIKESNPMVYDGIKSKIKNFQPIFHSMTPEGLNSRLTFLNQCMRPGDTIPTAVENGGQTQFQYNDVFNSAFGTPPVCVLRVGDFYHSKIIIDSLTFKYENAKFDINPEGIGVQPMIAEVSMNFNFIGGHGMNNPVTELQNALSFNYYANTEMYDDRATITDDVLGKFDDEVLDEIKNEIGLVEPSNTPLGEGDGNTLGNIRSGSTIDIQTSAITGTIQYKAKMNEFLDATGNYLNTIYSNFETLNQYLNLGGVLLFSKERSYSKGLYDYLDNTGSKLETNIFGKPVNYPNRVDELINRGKEDVDNLLTPPLAYLEYQNFKNSDIRKVKNKLKSMIDEVKSLYLSFLTDAEKNIVKEEINYIKYTDQMNFIISKRDGYKTKRNSIILYNISGKTEGVDPTSASVSDTYQELKGDFFTIGNSINKFNQKMSDLGVLPTGDTYTYKDDFKTQLFLNQNESDDTNPSVNVFYMLFGNEIINNPEGFITKLISPIEGSGQEDMYQRWKLFIYENLGFTPKVTSLGVSLPGGIGAPISTLEFIPKTNGGLVTDFKRSQDRMKKQFEDFKKYLDESLPDVKYGNFFKKERILDFEKQLTLNANDQQNFLNLWSTVDSTDEKYNLKKKMN